MSARKLGRLAGLVFVLVAVIGGGSVGAGAASAKPRVAVVASADKGTVEARTLEIIWD